MRCVEGSSGAASKRGYVILFGLRILSDQFVARTEHLIDAILRQLLAGIQQHLADAGSPFLCEARMLHQSEPCFRLFGPAWPRPGGTRPRLRRSGRHDRKCWRSRDGRSDRENRRALRRFARAMAAGKSLHFCYSRRLRPRSGSSPSSLTYIRCRSNPRPPLTSSVRFCRDSSRTNGRIVSGLGGPSFKASW